VSADIDQQRDIGKLWGAMERTNGDVRELRVAIVGIDGTNGLRGELREFIEQYAKEHSVRLGAVEDRVEEGIQFGQHLWEVERYAPGACIGKNALDKYVEDLNAKEKRSTDLSVELRKSRVAMMTAIFVAVITSAASVFVAVYKTGVAP